MYRTLKTWKEPWGFSSIVVHNGRLSSQFYLRKINATNSASPSVREAALCRFQTECLSLPYHPSVVHFVDAYLISDESCVNNIIDNSINPPSSLPPVATYWYCFVAKGVPKRDVTALIHAQKQLPVENRLFTEKQAQGYLLQLVLGLRHLHRHGLSHGDIRTCTVNVAREGNLVLNDYGFVAELKAAAATADPIDTPEEESTNSIYPPEWDGKPTEATDVFQLGCVLYTLLTLHRYNSAVLGSNRLPRISKKAHSHFSRSILSFMLECLSHDPQKRPSMSMSHPFLRSCGECLLYEWEEPFPELHSQLKTALAEDALYIEPSTAATTDAESPTGHHSWCSDYDQLSTALEALRSSLLYNTDIQNVLCPCCGKFTSDHKIGTNYETEAKSKTEVRQALPVKGGAGGARSGVGGSGVGGSGVGGSGVAGSGVAGSGAAGSGVAGSGVAGSGVAGSGVAGSGVHGAPPHVPATPPTSAEPISPTSRGKSATEYSSHRTSTSDLKRYPRPPSLSFREAAAARPVKSPRPRLATIGGRGKVNDRSSSTTGKSSVIRANTMSSTPRLNQQISPRQQSYGPKKYAPSKRIIRGGSIRSTTTTRQTTGDSRQSLTADARQSIKTPSASRQYIEDKSNTMSRSRSLSPKVVSPTITRRYGSAVRTSVISRPPQTRVE